MAGLSLDSPPDTASVCSGFETTATKALEDGSPYASEYVRGTFSYFLKQGICPDAARAWLEKLRARQSSRDTQGAPGKGPGEGQTIPKSP